MNLQVLETDGSTRAVSAPGYGLSAIRAAQKQRFLGAESGAGNRAMPVPAP
jgi:hypothetical protein